MTLALNERPRRRQGILLALAAFLSLVIGVGAALAIKAMPADATGADQTFINISSAACVDGSLEIHLLAPQGDEAASGTVLHYTLDGSTWLTVPETVDANGHLDWHLVLTGSSFDASDFAAWAGTAPRYEFGGHGLSHLEAALDECESESTGTLTIIKHVDNSQNVGATGSAQDWQISVMSGTTDVAGSPRAGSVTGSVYTLSPGTYTVSESGPAGYTQSWSSTCLGGTVVVTSGSATTCTLTNTANAAANVTFTVTVNKYVDGLPATTGSFDFITTTIASNIAGCDDADGCTHPFTLGPGSYMATTAAMAADSTYSVSEVNIDSTCDSDDTYELLGYKWGATLAAALALPSWSTDAPELTVTSDMYVVVANLSCDSGPVAGTGQITVQKVWNGTGGVHVGPAAVFTSTGSGVAGFTLTSGSAADSARTFTGLGLGSFSFTEAPQAGWHLSSINCSADDGSVLGSMFVSTSTAASVSLAAGAHVTCVFTNEQDVTAVAGTGQIKVQKVWNGTGGVHVGPAAVFTSTGSGVVGFSLTSGSAADSARTFTGLGLGSFSFTEAPQAGWHLSSINCSADDGSVLGSMFVTTTTAASVSLAAGAHVTCVFTNEQDVTTNRSIAILKVAAPNGETAAAGPFTGAIGSFGTFSVSIGGAASTPVSVPVNGAVSITENPNALGYTTVGFAPAVNGVCPPAAADYQANPSSYQVSPGNGDVTICVMNFKDLNAVGGFTPPTVFVPPTTLNPVPTTLIPVPTTTVPIGPITGPVVSPVLGVTAPVPVTIAPSAPADSVAGVRTASSGEIPLAPATGNGPASQGTPNLWVLIGMLAALLGVGMYGLAMNKRR